ncbi:hypothetical protein Ptc2401_01675 [Prosthecochloris sp. CIB 2401]|nr:hypothetical protein Ptc2401_01675 [Prosthecochloris sp. CIB 2401]
MFRLSLLTRSLSNLTIFLPLLNSRFPLFELLLVAGFALVLDAIEELVCGFELVGILFAPIFGELSFKGVFEERLAVYLELFTSFLQAFDAFIQLGEEFFDFGYDAVLLVERGNWKRIVP